MFPSLDPSKMSPALVSELSALMQTLPMDQILKMQNLMQRSMTGANVQSELMEFERNLPSSFRDKLFEISTRHAGEFSAMSAPQTGPTTVESTALESPDLTMARMTVLEAVADGRMTPTEAMKILFKSTGQ